MLVRAGCALFGDTTFGVRFWFLVLGALVPVGVFAIARPLVGPRDARLAAALTLVLPSTASLGLVATPDTPMLLLALAFAAAGVRAVERGATGAWVAAGVAGMAGVATHYRFSIVLAAGLGALLLSPRRDALRTRGPWLTAGLVSLGVVPTVVFNAQTDFVPLGYYFEGRHGVSFSLGAFGEFVVLQLLAVTPALFAAFVAIALAAVRRPSADGWLVRACVILFAFYVVASPFEDSGLPRLHWTLPAFAPLLVFLPTWLRAQRAAGRRWWPGLAVVLGPIVVAFGLGELGTDRYRLSTLKWNFTAWTELGDAVEKRLAADDPPDVIVAGSYRIGAQIDFALRGRMPVYVVDHPVNHSHGRALQASLWARGEDALRAHGPGRALFVIGVHEAPHGTTSSGITTSVRSLNGGDTTATSASRAASTARTTANPNARSSASSSDHSQPSSAARSLPRICPTSRQIRSSDPSLRRSCPVSRQIRASERLRVRSLRLAGRFCTDSRDACAWRGDSAPDAVHWRRFRCVLVQNERATRNHAS